MNKQKYSTQSKHYKHNPSCFIVNKFAFCRASLSEANSSLRKAEEKLGDSEREKRCAEMSLESNKRRLTKVKKLVDTIKWQKKATAEWQASINIALPVLRRIENSVVVRLWIFNKQSVHS